jgi:hypothetical protein
VARRNRAGHYLYVPLGGNRHGVARQATAALATFALGGLWHGASWSFLLWGLAHGAAIMAVLLWSRSKIVLPSFIGWLATFFFVALSWVLFRATSWADALKMYAGLFNLDEIVLYEGTPLAEAPWLIPALGALLLITGAAPNSNELALRFRPSVLWLFATLALAISAALRIGDYTEFLYFRF